MEHRETITIARSCRVLDHTCRRTRRDFVPTSRPRLLSLEPMTAMACLRLQGLTASQTQYAWTKDLGRLHQTIKITLVQAMMMYTVGNRNARHKTTLGRSIINRIRETRARFDNHSQGTDGQSMKIEGQPMCDRWDQPVRRLHQTTLDLSPGSGTMAVLLQTVKETFHAVHGQEKTMHIQFPDLCLPLVPSSAGKVGHLRFRKLCKVRSLA